MEKFELCNFCTARGTCDLSCPKDDCALKQVANCLYPFRNNPTEIIEMIKMLDCSLIDDELLPLVIKKYLPELNHIWNTYLLLK